MNVSVRALLICVRNRHQEFSSCLTPFFSWLQITYLEKRYLWVFRHKFYQKILPVMHIFSFTIMNYLKRFIGIKPLNRKQCPAGLSPIIIPSLSVPHLLLKDSKLNWFWLIIAVSPPLYKGDEGWSSVWFKKRGGKFRGGSRDFEKRGRSMSAAMVGRRRKF